MNWKITLANVIGGFLTAVIIDLNAWSKSEPGTSFKWNLAIQRWLAGAFIGLGSGSGTQVFVGLEQ